MTEMRLVRKIDEIGRIVLPREMREYLGFTKRSYARVQLCDNHITLTKAEQTDAILEIESIRKIDELGRVLLPKDMRDKLSWQVKEPIKIQVTENALILEKV
uniref:SpoVT-AbrB domain-containing protein n=1 Tax=uncultured Bacillota bacterium TaxID=344338 RepID=A0A650ENK6_9FIRM|nr:hypothetical protein Firmicute1046_2820 [uncultured Firmicutes bacterium]